MLSWEELVIKQINRSQKLLPKQLLNCIRNDTNSITGSNIRRILLLTRKSSLEEVSEQDIDKLAYEEVDEKDKWRVSIIRELLDCKNDETNEAPFQHIHLLRR